MRMAWVYVNNNEYAAMLNAWFIRNNIDLEVKGYHLYDITNGQFDDLGNDFTAFEIIKFNKNSQILNVFEYINKEIYSKIMDKVHDICEFRIEINGEYEGGESILIKELDPIIKDLL